MGWFLVLPGLIHSRWPMNCRWGGAVVSTVKQLRQHSQMVRGLNLGSNLSVWSLHVLHAWVIFRLSVFVLALWHAVTHIQGVLRIGSWDSLQQPTAVQKVDGWMISSGSSLPLTRGRTINYIRLDLNILLRSHKNTAVLWFQSMVPTWHWTPESKVLNNHLDAKWGKWHLFASKWNSLSPLCLILMETFTT